MLYRLIKTDMIKENITKDYHVVEKNDDSKISS